MTSELPGKNRPPAVEVRIRVAQRSDCSGLASLSHALWPDSAAEEHEAELTEMLDGKTALPAINLVAETRAGRLVGFLQAGLRSHADGCDPSQPVGYVEGWYVTPDYRQQGVGGRLLAEAENWARSLGCTEMASDAQIDNELSQRVHQALGYAEVDRCVHFRKSLF